MGRRKSLLICAAVVGLARMAAAGPSIILTEVVYDPPGSDTQREWVELYNAGSALVDISGWKLRDNAGVYTFDPGILLSPGQTLVIARSTAGFASLYGFDPDLGDLNLSLSNSGDFLRLFDLTDNLLDEVAWEGALPGWDLEAGTGESLKRVTLGTGSSAWAGGQSPGPGSPDPIPEPTTVLLVGAGMTVLFKLRKKR